MTKFLLVLISMSLSTMSYEYVPCSYDKDDNPKTNIVQCESLTFKFSEVTAYGRGRNGFGVETLYVNLDDNMEVTLLSHVEEDEAMMKAYSGSGKTVTITRANGIYLYNNKENGSTVVIKD